MSNNFPFGKIRSIPLTLTPWIKLDFLQFPPLLQITTVSTTVKPDMVF